MKLRVGVDGRTGELKFEQSGDDFTFSYPTSEATRLASLIEVEPGIFSLLVGTRSYEVRVVPVAEGYAVELNGRRSIVTVEDPRAMSGKSRSGGSEGLQRVASPMPGKVVRVLVTVGDSVDAGSGLVVVEAMKMQNEMKSPKAGRVLSVTAREGATVIAGEVLVEIE